MRGAMHAQLMGAAGQRRQRQPGRVGAAPLPAPQHSPFRLRGLALRIDFHPPAARGVQPPEREVDEAAFFAWRALDNRPIGLGDLALLEQEAKLFQRLMMAPKHEAARSLAIQPMRQRGPARQAEPQRVKVVF